MILPILCLGVVSFVIAWWMTWWMIRFAPKLGLVDQPGGRKIHAAPKPLGGGVAIVVAFVAPLAVTLAMVYALPESSFVRRFYPKKQVEILQPVGQGELSFKIITVPDTSLGRALWSGAKRQSGLAIALIVAVLVMHAMGLIDDRRALGPYVKLLVQLAVAAALVIPFREMRVLTAVDARLGAHGVLSAGISILWIVGITNAFNFLDNMDGLSAGVAAVCTTAFLVTTLSIQQWFVAASLGLLLGALLGFLYWNFPPAKIFMGDSGSLVIGLVLGVLTVRTTYLPSGTNWGAGWYSVFVPVIVLAVPLYDLVVVSVIRLMRRKSPLVGDTNHFSHRLVQRGMSRRTAVLCLYLVTAATAISAILLPHVQVKWGAILIVAQTGLVLGVVALLEQHPLPEAEAQKELTAAEDGGMSTGARG